MTDAPTLQGRQIVCVGFADWETDLWTNQHHLMSRLARENDVLFVESLGLRRPQLAGRDLRRIGRRVRNGLRGPREADGLHVLSPLVLPLHSNRLVRAVNARLLRMLVGRAARRLSLKRPILWSYVPQAETLLDALQPGLVVYHCVDDIAAQPGIDAAEFRAAEERFASRAELVLASAPALVERLQRISSNVVYAPNVADTEMFSEALEPGPLDPAMAALESPRIVFTGALVTSKLDMALMVELARMRPQWSFALVGPVGPGDPRADVSLLRAEPNIHLLGARRYRELPSVLRAADAGLIPYARNRLTSSIFPMKVYEYLAAGLPVVATPLPALVDVDEVATAADAAGIAGLLDEALAEESPQLRAERSRSAGVHSWNQRLRQIAGEIEALERSRPAISKAGAGSWDLLVSTHTPTLDSGRALRTYGVARALASERPLKLLYLPFGAADPAPEFARAGIELHEVRPSRGAKRLLAYARARVGGVPRDFARGISPELASVAGRLAGEQQCARVIADGPIAAATLSALARERPVIYNAHNLESSFRHQLDADRGLQGLASFERKLLALASESWMVSELDIDAARELCPSARLKLVPNVVDVAKIAPIRERVAQPRALFVANFAYEPNRNALAFLLREAMPLLWERLPDATLTLVGGGLSETIAATDLEAAVADARVEPLGFVADLTEVYERSRCAVVPLLQGGGTPLKLLEALAYGLPTVTTSRAADALGLRDGEHCLIADGARPFADALDRVLREQAGALGVAGRRFVKERYSIDALAQSLRG